MTLFGRSKSTTSGTRWHASHQGRIWMTLKNNEDIRSCLDILHFLSAELPWWNQRIISRAKQQQPSTTWRSYFNGQSRGQTRLVTIHYCSAFWRHIHCWTRMTCHLPSAQPADDTLMMPNFLAFVNPVSTLNYELFLCRGQEAAQSRWERTRKRYCKARQANEDCHRQTGARRRQRARDRGMDVVLLFRTKQQSRRLAFVSCCRFYCVRSQLEREEITSNARQTQVTWNKLLFLSVIATFLDLIVRGIITLCWYLLRKKKIRTSLCMSFPCQKDSPKKGKGKNLTHQCCNSALVYCTLETPPSMGAIRTISDAANAVAAVFFLFG